MIKMILSHLHIYHHYLQAYLPPNHSQHQTAQIKVYFVFKIQIAFIDLFSSDSVASVSLSRFCLVPIRTDLNGTRLAQAVESNLTTVGQFNFYEAFQEIVNTF